VIVRETLAKAGVEETVSDILDGNFPGSKAERIRSAMSRHHFGTDNTYMVGDTRSDIAEGREAGVWTVAVGWGFQNRDVLQVEQPDYFAAEPSDLLATFIRNRHAGPSLKQR
jgi:phosphoglycolate phosphatase